MTFTPVTSSALEAAVVLVNTALKPDTLTTVEAAVDFCDAMGYVGEKPRTVADVADLRAIRPRLRNLLSAERDEAVRMVNRILVEFDACPRLVRHDSLDWHIHAVSDDDPLPNRILVDTAMAMVDVIRADEMSRLGVCAADECEGLVLDLSRNRSRRFCSTACGNREAVAAYRARRGA